MPSYDLGRRTERHSPVAPIADFTTVICKSTRSRIIAAPWREVGGAGQLFSLYGEATLGAFFGGIIDAELN
jgi:hypothetical protein